MIDTELEPWLGTWQSLPIRAKQELWKFAYQSKTRTVEVGAIRTDIHVTEECHILVHQFSFTIGCMQCVRVRKLANY